MRDNRSTAVDGRGQPSSSNTGAAGGRDDLAQLLSTLARDLQHEQDVDRTLNAIVHAAAGTVPGAGLASISTIIKRREVRTRAATSDLPRAVDQAQYTTGQGPCLQSLYVHQTVRVADMAAEPRWPEFARQAEALGVRSMLALQLYVQGDNLGALNLMSEQRDAFGDESERIGLLFAAHAGVAMAGALEAAHLRQAIDSRDLIGQAKGILMERHKITGDRAFEVLVRVSQASNRKLVEIAHELAATGEVRPD